MATTAGPPHPQAWADDYSPQAPLVGWCTRSVACGHSVERVVERGLVRLSVRRDGAMSSKWGSTTAKPGKHRAGTDG